MRPRRAARVDPSLAMPMLVTPAVSSAMRPKGNCGTWTLLRPVGRQLGQGDTEEQQHEGQIEPEGTAPEIDRRRSCRRAPGRSAPQRPRSRR